MSLSRILNDEPVEPMPPAPRASALMLDVSGSSSTSRRASPNPVSTSASTPSHSLPVPGVAPTSNGVSVAAAAAAKHASPRPQLHPSSPPPPPASPPIRENSVPLPDAKEEEDDHEPVVEVVPEEEALQVTAPNASGQGQVDGTSTRRRRRQLSPPVAKSPGKKKKKVAHVERYATRRQPTRSSKHPTATPPVDVPAPPPTDEELRLASSDLSDCEELWIQELSYYMLETHKRQQQVEMWFEDSCVARNNEIARARAGRYARRLSMIPPPPPLPSQPLPSLRHFERYQYEPDLSRRSPSIDLYEDSILGSDIFETPPNEVNIERPRRKGPSGGEWSKSKHHTNRHGRDYIVPIDVQSEEQWREGSSDFEVPDANWRVVPQVSGKNLKRKHEEDEDDNITNDVERSIDDAQSISVTVRKEKLIKGKNRATPAPSTVDSDVGRAKKRKWKKKDIDILNGGTATPSLAPSIADDATPIPSGPPSPALSSTLIFEIDDIPPPMKRAKRVDDLTMIKRLQGLEESQRKVWLNIARRDVAKVYKHHLAGYQARQVQTKRTANLCATQAKRPFYRSVKSTKETQIKAKRLMREMMVFWKKNEKEERDIRKRAEKEADNRAKELEEKREAARQARKLEFLISQTELYSHFVRDKLNTAELEGDTAAAEEAPKGAEGPAEPEKEDIDFDDEDTTNLHAHARKNAMDALSRAKLRANEFDAESALERKTNEARALAKAQAHVRDDDEFVEGEDSGEKTTGLVDLDSDELNFQNPTSLMGPLTIGQPRMLQAQLKEYQLKGLNWLGTLYDQGINGILADEMGLGKTVQSISLLAYLAETHDIWGPFLVVAPASTLHNWQQELTRFVPQLKALPYWGNVKDRATLRKFWSKKEISYNQDAPFHVLITSYQLVTQDQQYFQRVKWQYMILDEAQNIKNSSSARWKTLLGFQCRNRLLLTGTPIQNNMQELWALLHFIMPSLFDSHDEFNEWFSKDIETAAADNKGSKLNERQLRRLHMILKPFMLRRVKRHVQNELSEKIEIDIHVDLSARQRALYKALRANISVTDLIEKAKHVGDVEAARTLMNLVMQFRKVCNHPELFERADVVAPFSFSVFGRPGSIAREGDFVACHYSTRNPIEVELPVLLLNGGGLVGVPSEDAPPEPEHGVMRNLFNIWSTDYIERSLRENAASPFNFAPLLGMSPKEVHDVHFSKTISRLVALESYEARRLEEEPFMTDSFFDVSKADRTYRLPRKVSWRHLDVAEGLPPLHEIATDRWAETCLSRPSLRWYVPPVIAPHAGIYMADRNFVECEERLLEAPLESLALYGAPPDARESPVLVNEFAHTLPGVPLRGLFHHSPVDQLPLSYMQVPEAKRLIYDSAKLARLDSLLHELKANDHRVLIYFQMTRMMDLMEEYLIYRQYKYLRLDGGSKLEDRRDMVMDWQTKPDIFIFLLSTRAGGLGINLTAADTVVFYDHDWNPSNDAQAMDRAHRLGQTRQVTVYRLITKGTIDERIVQLARVKKDVQDIVVGNKSFTDATKPNEIVSLLLNDDELANLEKQNANGKAALDSKPAASSSSDKTNQVVRDLWAEEGDEFFGPNNMANGNGGGSGAAGRGFGNGVPDGENLDGDATPEPAVTSGARGGKKRKGAKAGEPPREKRKPGPKKGYKRKHAVDAATDDAWAV